MSLSHSLPSSIDSSASCPVHAHSLLPRQKTSPVVEPVDRPVECDEQGVWHIRGFEEARTILRSKDVRQAGFNAEQLNDMQMLRNKPILYLEGKDHQQQRKQTARFFAPKTISSSYCDFIGKLSDQLIRQLKRKKTLDLDRLSLVLAVQVAARVVGLTNSRVPGMTKRLDIFLHMNMGDESPSSRWKLLNIIRGVYGQRHMLAFFVLDVLPAVRARQRQLQEDVISHLIGLKYSDLEILTECVTYAAAGMATTREFISIVTWHFLEHPELRERYLAAPEEERFEMLHEVLRLEPVVAHLYRRTVAPLVLTSQGKQITIPEGAMIDLHIYSANADEGVVGEEPLALCPARELHGERIPSMLMSFGDGAHRCPGSFLAIQETDIFLQRLLALDHLRIVRAPRIDRNEAVYSYELRRFMLTIEPTK
jgi:cytochrome P450